MTVVLAHHCDSGLLHAEVGSLEIGVDHITPNLGILARQQGVSSDSRVVDEKINAFQFEEPRLDSGCRSNVELSATGRVDDVSARFQLRRNLLGEIPFAPGNHCDRIAQIKGMWEGVGEWARKRRSAYSNGLFDFGFSVFRNGFVRLAASFAFFNSASSSDTVVLAELFGSITTA